MMEFHPYQPYNKYERMEETMSVYEFNVKTTPGKEVSLAEYKGKVLLIVNTASKCGFTPQYEDLQKLFDTYHARGLEILAFPCDQFAHQEPGTDEEIQAFCKMNYGVTFPVFAKIDVNGKSAHPLFQYLRAQKKGAFGNPIKWNFTKFLISRNGEFIDRYESAVKPMEIAPAVESLL
jgi:glutathione peroxidase